MNQLSWLLYLAELSESLSAAAWIIFTMCVVFATVVTVAAAIVQIELDYDDENKVWTFLKTHTKTLIIVWSLAMTVGVFLPSKDTVYAIAASEMGEELLKTPTATKAVKALDAWLDKQIAK